MISPKHTTCLDISRSYCIGGNLTTEKGLHPKGAKEARKECTALLLIFSVIAVKFFGLPLWSIQPYFISNIRHFFFDAVK
jgi:hypothetical protein